MTSIAVSALHIYPIKSCKGIPVTQASLTPTGLQWDRHWMLVNIAGRFMTQRELPHMALVEPTLSPTGLQIAAPGRSSLAISIDDGRQERRVKVWDDTLDALDEGDVAANWFSTFLQTAVRLVRFHPERRRISSREWTGEIAALNQFSDGYSLLALSEASLVDLNKRLEVPLPMNRFRPNLVLSGTAAYDEDRIYELYGDGVRLRIVKPCGRCKITTTDQITGVPMGDEPLTTLRSYRWNEQLRRVTFGQNVIVIEGAGRALSIGQSLQIVWKQ
jgi:uncharacterized protein